MLLERILCTFPVPTSNSSDLLDEIAARDRQLFLDLLEALRQTCLLDLQGFHVIDLLLEAVSHLIGVRLFSVLGTVFRGLHVAELCCFLFDDLAKQLRSELNLHVYSPVKLTIPITQIFRSRQSPSGRRDAGAANARSAHFDAV